MKWGKSKMFAVKKLKELQEYYAVAKSTNIKLNCNLSFGDLLKHSVA
jgi:hypothetical protein